MIEKVDNVSTVSCDLCDWNTEKDDENTARAPYNRHVKQAHGQTKTKITEGQGISPDEKQIPLPGPISPQGREKEHK
jgi:hypothetical protein